MTLSRIATLLALPLVLLGCGISDSTLLSDIDEGDAAKVCEEFAQYARTVTCTFGDQEIEIEMGMGTVEECTADYEPLPEGCPLTMGDMRACMDATFALTDEEICTQEAPLPECTVLMDEACFTEGETAE